MGYSPPLTGDATSTAATPTVTSLVGTANVESIIRANPLNQFAAATGNYPMGGNYLTGLGQGVVSTHSAQLGQLAGTQMPYVVSGCVWTADSSGSTLFASMTAGTVMIRGILLTVAAVVSRAFTASVDTYVDLADNGDGTAAIFYTTVGNNADSPVLANSGTALTTIRCAMITSGATAIVSGNINQGRPSITTPPTTAQTSTVAAGSNGANITATTLAVAANTLPTAGLCVVDTSAGTGSNFGSVIRYTSGGGTTTLSGVTVLSGSGTVSTGGVVTAISQNTVSDSIGNRIFPCSPYPGLLSYRQFVNTITTTKVAQQQPVANFTHQFVIPPGPSRLVKHVGHLSFIGSSAVAGTVVQCQGTIDAGTVSSAQANVAVASDGLPIHPEGIALLAPGVHTAALAVGQAAAGTLTVGITYLLSACYVELV